MGSQPQTSSNFKTSAFVVRPPTVMPKISATPAKSVLPATRTVTNLNSSPDWVNQMEKMQSQQNRAVIAKQKIVVFQKGGAQHGQDQKINKGQSMEKYCAYRNSISSDIDAHQFLDSLYKQQREQKDHIRKDPIFDF